MTKPNRPRTALLPPTHRGSASAEEMQRRADAGEWPRKDWMEVARLLDADVIDFHHMKSRGTPVTRLVAGLGGLQVGQVCEALFRRHQYDRILPWSDRIGLPLALLFKLVRSHPDLVLRSVDLAYGKKAFLIRRLRAHTALQAVVTPSSRQLQIAAERLGVPRAKLYFDPHGTDTEFWRPRQTAAVDIICSAGWEARDYATLIRAVADLPIGIHVAIGTLIFRERRPDSDRPEAPGGLTDLMPGYPIRRTRGYRLYRRWRTELGSDLPSNVRWHQQLSPLDLRSLYARSRFVVIPLFDVEFDAGATAVLEAMAMGKAIVLTRTRGQVDLVVEGENGMYVPPRDPNALCAAIQHLLDHPEEAERMGRAGRKRAEQFQVEPYARRIADLVVGLESCRPGAASR
jgi:glycosyltransferase involved in cell wall biosynthesis